MMASPDSWCVQKNGCRCLSASSCTHEVAPFVLSAIGFSMRICFESQIVQESACHAMSAIMQKHGLVARTPHVEAIVESMRMYPTTKLLQYHGCLALSALSRSMSIEHQESLFLVLISASENFPDECGKLAESTLS